MRVRRERSLPPVHPPRHRLPRSLLSLLLSGVGLFWSSHEVHVNQAAQRTEQAQQRKQGERTLTLLCTTFGEARGEQAAARQPGDQSQQGLRRPAARHPRPARRRPGLPVAPDTEDPLSLRALGVVSCRPKGSPRLPQWRGGGPGRLPSGHLRGVRPSQGLPPRAGAGFGPSALRRSGLAARAAGGPADGRGHDVRSVHVQVVDVELLVRPERQTPRSRPAGQRSCSTRRRCTACPPSCS